MQKKQNSKQKHQDHLNCLLDSHQMFLSGSYKKMLDSLLSAKLGNLETSLWELENVMVPDIDFATNNETKSLIDGAVEECVKVFSS